MPTDNSPPIGQTPRDGDSPRGSSAEESRPNPSYGNHVLGNADSQGAAMYINEFSNIKLASFWRNRPKLWFTQLEAEFAAHRVRSDQTMYNSIIRHLDEQTMNEVADILEDPPETGKYLKLKLTLIERFADSTEKQFRTLLRDMHLGTKKPSSLLREMRTLAGSNVTNELLRTLWLQRLPTRIQEILVVLEGVDLDKLAACADKAIERSTSPSISTVAATTDIGQIEKLTQQVSELTCMVAALDARRSRSRSKEGPKARERTASDDRKKYCYFHRRFKDKARKCTQPCAAPFPLATPENWDNRRQ